MKDYTLGRMSEQKKFADLMPTGFSAVAFGEFDPNSGQLSAIFQNPTAFVAENEYGDTYKKCSDFAVFHLRKK